VNVDKAFHVSPLGKFALFPECDVPKKYIVEKGQPVTKETPYKVAMVKVTRKFDPVTGITNYGDPKRVWVLAGKWTFPDLEAGTSQLRDAFREHAISVGIPLYREFYTTEPKAKAKAKAKAKSKPKKKRPFEFQEIPLRGKGAKSRGGTSRFRLGSKEAI
jgi:hypothetical protein